MSWASVFIHHTTGLPEINLHNNPATAPLVDPLIAALESEIFANKLPQVLDALPDNEQAAMLADITAAIARRQAKEHPAPAPVVGVDNGAPTGGAG